MYTALNTVSGRRLPLIFLLLTFLMVGFWNVGRGQLLLNDDFTGYRIGNLGGQSKWVNVVPSGANSSDATISNALPLTYAGYNGGGNEYVVLPTPNPVISRTYCNF